MTGCGCEERKEIIFTQGNLNLACLLVLIAFPTIAYLAGRMAKQ